LLSQRLSRRGLPCHSHQTVEGTSSSGPDQAGGCCAVERNECGTPITFDIVNQGSPSPFQKFCTGNSSPFTLTEAGHPSPWTITDRGLPSPMTMEERDPHLQSTHSDRALHQLRQVRNTHLHAIVNHQQSQAYQTPWLDSTSNRFDGADEPRGGLLLTEVLLRSSRCVGVDPW
jgi:hypothetical protein